MYMLMAKVSGGESCQVPVDLLTLLQSVLAPNAWKNYVQLLTNILELCSSAL